MGVVVVRCTVAFPSSMFVGPTKKRHAVEDDYQASQDINENGYPDDGVAGKGHS